jgi:putative sterol carrier protein
VLDPEQNDTYNQLDPDKEGEAQARTNGLPEPSETPSTGAQTAFAKLADKLDGANPGLTATLKFDLGEDATYRLVFEDGACRAEAGDGPATTTVRMKAEDGLKLITGELNPMVAFTSGKIRIEGDIRVLMAMQGALG